MLVVLLTIHVRIWMNPEGGLGRDEVQTGYHLDIILSDVMAEDVADHLGVPFVSQTF